MARPKSKAPKNKVVGFRLNTSDRELLDRLMATTNLEQGDVMRLLIRNVDLQRAREAIGR
jgi:hypothetical protein